jgi:hypothetical protein
LEEEEEQEQKEWRKIKKIFLFMVENKIFHALINMHLRGLNLM